MRTVDTNSGRLKRAAATRALQAVQGGGVMSRACSVEKLEKKGRVFEIYGNDALKSVYFFM
jgi:hypothetical protein